MKINKQNKQNMSFKGSFYSSKSLLKSLKFAAEKGAIVAAGTTLACSTIIRPAAILLTPDSSKEDKQYACTKSIASGVLSAILTASIFTPVSKVIDNISKKPNDYLNSSTIKNLQQSANTLDEAPAYNFIKQIAKMSPELFAVLPKALITAVLIVPVTKFIFNKKPKEKKQPAQKSSSNPSFKGLTSKLSKRIVGIMENKRTQKIALKYQDTNFIQHSLNLKDVYATACFSAITAFNTKIKKENKNTLIYNTTISTALTIGGGYVVDKALQKPVKKFTDNFIKANKNDPNLYKYLNGIKILKPIVILSSLYYVVIPMLSTFCAGKLAKNNKRNKITSEK